MSYVAWYGHITLISMFSQPEEEETKPVEEPAPERPWTPSYSVTRQGSSPAHSPQIPEDEPEQSIPERPLTPSYSVYRQGTSPISSPRPLEEETKDESAPAIAIQVTDEPVADEALAEAADPGSVEPEQVRCHNANVIQRLLKTVDIGR